MKKSQQKDAALVVEFEDEYLAGIRDIFENKIVFNSVLGLRLTFIGPEQLKARIDMKPELIGSYGHNRVHGGVISAALDTLAGMAVIVAQGSRHMDETPAQRLQRFNRLATIDLRVDYLRPAIGDYFELQAEVMRLGSRVASTRMEFFAADGKLLCMGTGSYIVS